MPTLDTLSIQHFRNLTAVNLVLSPRFNIFYGNNASGKTSLLEAIYYLGMGKSFRTAYPASIIQHQTDQFLMFAKIQNATQQHVLGIERTREGERQIKLDGENQIGIAPVTKLLPIQFMSPTSYRFFHDGPKIRRQYLDWALFHVEHDFLFTWQRWQRVLKQRNSALKSRQNVEVWNYDFITLGESIDQMRRQMFLHLLPICLQQLQLLLPDIEFSVRYSRGWDNGTDLRELLYKYAQRDRQLGYTYYGPQRADLQLWVGSDPVQNVLSQGQQKLAAYALHLALGTVLHQYASSNPIYLVDDLPSELDSKNRVKILSALASLQAQVFITSISAQDLGHLTTDKPIRMFHVEHGKIEVLESTLSVLESTS